MDRRAVLLTIRGRVQGVGFRAWAAEAARRLELAGWARNRRDGSVEVLAIGFEAALEQLAEACRRGPADAAVISVEHAPAEDDGIIGFRVQPTL